MAGRNHIDEQFLAFGSLLKSLPYNKLVSWDGIVLPILHNFGQAKETIQHLLFRCNRVYNMWNDWRKSALNSNVYHATTEHGAGEDVSVAIYGCDLVVWVHARILQAGYSGLLIRNVGEAGEERTSLIWWMSSAFPAAAPDFVSMEWLSSSKAAQFQWALWENRSAAKLSCRGEISNQRVERLKSV